MKDGCRYETVGVPYRISISRSAWMPDRTGSACQPEICQIPGLCTFTPAIARMRRFRRMRQNGRRTGRQLHRQPPYLARAELVQRTWHHPRQTSGIRRIPTAQAVDEDECQATDDTAAASGDEYLAGEKRNGQGRQASFGCRAT